MSPRSSTVLKSGQVRLVRSPAPTIAAPSSTEPETQPVQARIYDQTPEAVILEVTCGCGRKIYLRCDYAQTNAAKGHPNPEGAKS
jgi:hypothetical protein